MAALINTTEGYLAQMIGQLVIEKATLLGEGDKLRAELEAERSRKNEPNTGGLPVGANFRETVAGTPQG